MRESLLALTGIKHVITRAKPEVIQIWIATPHSVRLAMTGKVKVAHAVRLTAMTMIKIFNSINIGDYSLMNYSPLFIKKIY